MLRSLHRCEISCRILWVWLIIFLGLSAFAESSHAVNQSLPMSTHQIYDLSIPIPVHWKVSRDLSDDESVKSGSFLAIDHSKSLNYPRNIEIKVIGESVSANHYYAEKISKALHQKFLGSYRGLDEYNTVHSEVTKISNVKSILLFSHFWLSGSEMSHVHLVVPRSEYYYLITYTDFKSRLSSSSDESFEVFWSIAENISLPSESFFSTVVQQESAFALMVFASLALLVLLGVLFHLLKNLARLSPHPTENHLDMDDFQRMKPSSLSKSRSKKRSSSSQKPSMAMKPRSVSLIGQTHDEPDVLDFKEFSMTQDLGSLNEIEHGFDATLMDQLDIATRIDKDKKDQSSRTVVQKAQKKKKKLKVTSNKAS